MCVILSQPCICLAVPPQVRVKGLLMETRLRIESYKMDKRENNSSTYMCVTLSHATLTHSKQTMNAL